MRIQKRDSSMSPMVRDVNWEYGGCILSSLELRPVRTTVCNLGKLAVDIDAISVEFESQVFKIGEVPGGVWKCLHRPGTAEDNRCRKHPGMTDIGSGSSRLKARPIAS